MKKVLLTAICLSGVLALSLSGSVNAEAQRSGYLDTLPDLTKVVPPPPQKADPRYDADRRVFLATRAMLHTPRGDLATRDVPYLMPDLMRDFGCSAALPLSPTATPATYRLLFAADTDTQAANEAAKRTWKRLRPFQIDSGPICQNKADLVKSYDYPSGHTAHGWTVASILADLLPDRAPFLFARARAYGESRILCGAHNMSAVEASPLGVTVSLQQIRLSPRYQADFLAAKAELQQVRGGNGSLSGATCAAEDALTRRSLLSDLPTSARSRRGLRP
ncbi:acid phosphatase (class A) [Novosphingobium sp. SG751A]|uniref:acid phosphatase n=1 Tax=Novosphingobium sp. SG751A TaxID=2587000 RepID=UPI0015565786|nr:phosphatase PAP2 family protein [Novosphingobium sp. SG751A]NOW44991.1 acid phosphatase (class A) [Novosphingobium sp. SG751A]